MAANAQFYQVFNTTGIATVGGVGITTTGVGSPPPSTVLYTGGSCGVTNTFTIGNGGVSNGFKYSFSKPITRVRLRVYHIQSIGDTLTVFVNDSQYFLTSANVSFVTGTCAVLTPCIADAFGKFAAPFSSTGCGDANYNGNLDISPGYMIDSFRTLSNVNSCPGIAYNFYFDTDTFVYIKQPFYCNKPLPRRYV